MTIHNGQTWRYNNSLGKKAQQVRAASRDICQPYRIEENAKCFTQFLASEIAATCQQW